MVTASSVIRNYLCRVQGFIWDATDPTWVDFVPSNTNPPALSAFFTYRRPDFNPQASLEVILPSLQ